MEESELEPSLHKTTRHKCAACFQQFKKKEHLVAHMKTSHHSVHQPKCGVCQKHCKSFESLREHISGPLAKAHCSSIFSQYGCQLCMKVFESPIILAEHKDQCLLTAPDCIGTVNIPYIDCEALEDESYIGKGRDAVAIDCQMVGCGTDGSLDVLARVCLVDEEENIIFDTYVEPQITVTDYRMCHLRFEPRSNVTAFLDLDNPKTMGYRDCIHWLKNSSIGYAISESTTIYESHIRDFWRTAQLDIHSDPSCLKARVLDEDISFSEKDVSRILRLEADSGDEVSISGEEVLSDFRRMGYEGLDLDSRKEFRKSYLPKEWRYIAHVFIMCLGHRKGGFDGLNLEWGKAMALFCKGEKANIARLIFKCMSENLSAMKKDKWLMYPRFIQLILNDLKPNLRVVGDTLQLTTFNSRIFADCNLPRADCSGKITYLWENMYPADRWTYIRRLIESERKLAADPQTRKSEETKKRKRLIKGKDYDFEKDLDKAEAATRAEREKKSKHKQPVFPESSQRRDTRSELDEDIIRAVKASVADELSLVKTKIVNMEAREREKEMVINGLKKDINGLKKVVVEQRDLIKRLLKDINEIKVNAGLPNVLSEAKIDNLTDLSKYPFLHVGTFGAREGVGGSGVGGSGGADESETEPINLDDDNLRLGVEDLVGDEVFQSDAPQVYKLVDEEEEEDAELGDGRCRGRCGGGARCIHNNREKLTYIWKKGSEEEDVVEIDKSDWFEKVDESPTNPSMFQNMEKETVIQMERRIVSWKYNTELKVFMVKRRGGGISYFNKRKHFKTLPRWDLRRLAELPLIDAYKDDKAKFLEREIQNATKANFISFGYQKPERRVQKKDKHWVSWKGKVALKLKPAKTMNRVKLPDLMPRRLEHFEKWFYNNQTGEAVIRVKDGGEMRLFDPMEVFAFCEEDLKVLCENQIRVGAGAETVEEAALFMRIANRARRVRADQDTSEA